jgi:hypothetical protein
MIRFSWIGKDGPHAGSNGKSRIKETGIRFPLSPRLRRDRLADAILCWIPAFAGMKKDLIFSLEENYESWNVFKNHVACCDPNFDLYICGDDRFG